MNQSQPDPRAARARFTASADGTVVDDDDNAYDATIRIGGDFGSLRLQREYAQAVADALNAMPPRVPDEAERVEEAETERESEPAHKRNAAEVDHLVAAETRMRAPRRAVRAPALRGVKG